MFPLDLKTPTDESYDPTAEVEEALKRVVLQPEQQAVMCNGCGHWWVVDEHEYTPYDGAAHHYPRIAGCPRCELGDRESP